MSFQPILQQSGLAGWAFLKRTKERQQTSFNATPALQRDVDHFRKSLPGLVSVKSLVDDRRVLKVALGAFGLQDDINNRAFIHKLIEDGTSERKALANRLTDKRYFAFAKAFEYLANTSTPSAEAGFADRIATAYRSREFEIAVGAQDQSMRLALTLQRDLPLVAAEFATDSARWFAVLGNPPLRETLQTSLGFPQQFAQLDVDLQVRRMKAAAKRKFGTDELQKLGEPESLQRITRDFLVMSQLRDTSTVMTGTVVALTLLQQSSQTMAQAR